MEFLTFLNDNSGAISVIVTIVLAIFTIHYARLTRRSQALVEKLIDNPKVVASLRNDEVNSSLLIVCIENVGTGTARNVRFQTNFSIQVMGDISLEDIGFLKKGIDYFGSGQKYEFPINTIIGKKAWEELMQTPLVITITYDDSAGNPQPEEKAHLDFGTFEGLPLVKSPVGKIVETTKDMVKATEKMGKATEEIGKVLNQYTRIRAGDKVRTCEEIRGATKNGDLSYITRIPKGELCTVLEITREDITLEWDDAPDSEGRVIYRGYRSLSEPFVLEVLNLPPHPYKVSDSPQQHQEKKNVADPVTLLRHLK